MVQSKTIKLTKTNKRKELLNQEDELTGEEVITYLKSFLDCESRVHDPKDEIKIIFDKI